METDDDNRSERNPAPSDKAPSDNSHMGAMENEVVQRRPPTKELGQLSDSPQEKGKKSSDDYDPSVETTPG